jgi:hypothetical protein
MSHHVPRHVALQQVGGRGAGFDVIFNCICQPTSDFCIENKPLYSRPFLKKQYDMLRSNRVAYLTLEEGKGGNSCL